MDQERVLVVPTAVFHRLGHFQGFCGDVRRYLPELIDPRQISFQPRSQVEDDPSFKQLIPYVIFRHRPADGSAWLFHYTRGTGQGEGRLHRKRSIGVGGHICWDDTLAADTKPYSAGLRRELQEEVRVETPFEAACVGLINDDETPVGQVHLGVVHIYDVAQPRVFPREADLLQAGFSAVEGLISDLASFETWSQICLRALFETRPPA